MNALDEETLLASELRVVVGQLVRRLRSEVRLSLSQAAVMGRLDREGPLSISELAVAERVRPQSMAQTIHDLEEQGHVVRRPDPEDRRRALIQLTDTGLQAVEADRRKRDGWLADVIGHHLSADERRLLTRTVPILRRIADADPV
jgi:DNA-binding MarR family transcriptional regulator